MECHKSLTDRTEFERIRTDCADRLATLVGEYEEDARKLGVNQQADHLTEVVLEAVREIPFPEEAVVTQNDVVGGLFNHLTGARSAKDQVQDRFAKLTTRYETWWGRYGPPYLGSAERVPRGADQLLVDWDRRTTASTIPLKAALAQLPASGQA